MATPQNDDVKLCVMNYSSLLSKIISNLCCIIHIFLVTLQQNSERLVEVIWDCSMRCIRVSNLVVCSLKLGNK